MLVQAPECLSKPPISFPGGNCRLCVGGGPNPPETLALCWLFSWKTGKSQSIWLASILRLISPIFGEPTKFSPATQATQRGDTGACKKNARQEALGPNDWGRIGLPPLEPPRWRCFEAVRTDSSGFGSIPTPSKLLDCLTQMSRILG